MAHENLPAEITEIFGIICDTSEEISRLTEQLVSDVTPIVASIVNWFDSTIFEVAPVSGRVKHLARYAKKKRVRKKNLNRMYKACLKRR